MSEQFVTITFLLAGVLVVLLFHFLLTFLTEQTPE